MKPSIVTYLFLIFSIQFATASNSTAVANICQNAIDASCGAVFHGKYEDLTNDVNLVCGNVSNPQKELVFKFNATTSTNLQVVVDYDYGGVNVTDVTDVTFSVMSACDASTCITNYTGELIEFSNWVGELYFVISFPAPGGLVGDYTILFSCNDEPGGNACDNAVPLTIGQTYSYQGNEAAQRNWVGELQCPNAFTTHMLGLDRTHTFTLETTSTVTVAIDAGIYSPNFSLFFGCDFKKICLRNSSGYNTMVLTNLHPGIYTIVVESIYLPELSYDLLVSNLDCASASTINCGIDIEGSNNLATNDVFQNNCNYFPAPDVLYKYVHLSSGDLTVSLQTDNNMQLEVAIFDECNVSKCVAFGTLGTTYANASAGTYYILVDGNQSNDYDNYTLYINCPPITNDDCTDAPPITVSSYGNCNFVNGSTIGSTDDGSHSCENGFRTGVWYKFVAPPSGVIVYKLSDYTEFFFPNVVVFDACNGNEVHCARYKYRVGGLTAGVTYYLNVTSEVGKETDFSLCLYEPPAPPANDLCSNAIPIVIGDIGYCTPSQVNGTLIGAIEDPEPTCGANGPIEYNGVWYSFTAPPSGKLLISSFQHENFSYPNKLVIYETCIANEVVCLSFPSFPDTISGLQPNQNYLINIWNYAEKEANFSFCLEEIPLPVTNDNCATAMLLSVGNQSCIEEFGYTTNATDSGENSPSCGWYTGKDVWFKVLVPASGRLTVETKRRNPSSVVNTEMAIYTGNCNNLVFIECDEDDGDDGYLAKINLTNRAAGETLYIRVWGSGLVQQIFFNICAYEPSQSNVSCAILNSPNNQAVDVSTDPTLMWNSISNAVGYKIYAGTDGNGTTQPSNLVNGTVTDDSSGPSYTLFGLSPSTTYYWQIIPFNDNLEEAENCLIYSFTTGGDIFSCPEDTISAEIRNQLHPAILLANNSIESTDTIETYMFYMAGQSITLLPGFHAKLGSDFTAIIAASPCGPPMPLTEAPTEAKLNSTQQKYSKQQDDLGLTVFPNPFSNSTNIQFTLATTSPLSIQLYDLNGRLFKTIISNTNHEAGSYQMILTSEGLQAGIYYLNMVNNQEKLVKKIMIVH